MSALSNEIYYSPGTRGTEKPSILQNIKLFAVQELSCMAINENPICRRADFRGAKISLIPPSLLYPLLLLSCDKSLPKHTPLPCTS